MNTDSEIYDQNDYYGGDSKASRLTPILNGLLHILDWAKAWNFARKLGIRPNRGAVDSGDHRYSVLDIGAGDGKFLYFMRKLGFEPQGTTASAISQKAAKQQFGIDLQFSKEIPVSLQTKKFHAISYWHVFEHLENPESHVSVWPKILAPEGIVMIEVPNMDSVGAYLSFHAWLGSDVVHHINHMSAARIESLLAKFGLKVFRREGFSLKFTYPFLWSALLGRIFGEKRYSFDSVFNTLKSPLTGLRKHPFLTLNALLSIVYLAPIILVLSIVGLILGRGEVTRFYIRRAI